MWGGEGRAFGGGGGGYNSRVLHTRTGNVSRVWSLYSSTTAVAALAPAAVAAAGF